MLQSLNGPADAGGAMAALVGDLQMAALSAAQPESGTETMKIAFCYESVLPGISLCTDNAAMVASVAWWRLVADGPTPLDAGAYPSLKVGEISRVEVAWRPTFSP